MPRSLKQFKERLDELSNGNIRQLKATLEEWLGAYATTGSMDLENVRSICSEYALDGKCLEANQADIDLPP